MQYAVLGRGVPIIGLPKRPIPFYVSPQVLDISSIESVQRCAARFVVDDYSYH